MRTLDSGTVVAPMAFKKREKKKNDKEEDKESVLTHK